MKLTQQLNHCYSANRRAAQPLQFHVTSLGGKTKERLDRIGDYSSWDVSTDITMWNYIRQQNSFVRQPYL